MIKLCGILLLWSGSFLFAQSPDPINLFAPVVGQTQIHIGMPHDSSSADTTTYTVVSISGDSAYFTWGQPGEFSITMDTGVVMAGGILRSGMLDTNNIYANLMKFPEDYNAGDKMGERQFGYVLNYEIQGIVFDTLLASCYYMSFLDAGDMCDFVTTDGFLAHSVNNNCFCVAGGFSAFQEEEVLELISGETMSIRQYTREYFPVPEFFGHVYDLMGRRHRENKGPMLFLDRKYKIDRN